MRVCEMAACIQQEKQELQHELGQKISATLNQFYEETGLSPEYISVDMVRRQTIGSPDRHYFNGVRVTLGL